LDQAIGSLLAISIALSIAAATFLLTEVVLKPSVALRALIGEVDYSLTFYADRWANPGVAPLDKTLEASFEIRNLAARLRSSAHSVPMYRLASWTRIIPPYSAVREAGQLLIRLSNSLDANGSPLLNNKDADAIRTNLRLPTR
jgi:hypothetical protein